MPSKKIAYGDGFSRLISDNAELLEEIVIAALKQEQELMEVLITPLANYQLRWKKLKKQQKRMST